MIRRVHLTRRSALGGVSAGLLTGLIAPRPAMAATPADGPLTWSGPTSANGWPISADHVTVQVEGSPVNLTLAAGIPRDVLVHAARRISYELEPLRAGDLQGLTTDRSVASRERSNLLSGTAILYRSGHFPHGEDGNLFPEQIRVLEDIVAESNGVLAWGGQLSTPDQGLIYLAERPGSATSRLAQRFRKVDRMDSSSGAGTIDVGDPRRRRATERFLRRRAR